MPPTNSFAAYYDQWLRDNADLRGLHEMVSDFKNELKEGADDFLSVRRIRRPVQKFAVITTPQEAGVAGNTRIFVQTDAVPSGYSLLVDEWWSKLSTTRWCVPFTDIMHERRYEEEAGVWEASDIPDGTIIAYLDAYERVFHKTWCRTALAVDLNRLGVSDIIVLPGKKDLP